MVIMLIIIIIIIQIKIRRLTITIRIQILTTIVALTSTIISLCCNFESTAANQGAVLLNCSNNYR